LLIFLFENEIVVISLTIVVFDAGYYPVKHLFCFLYKGRAGFAIIDENIDLFLSNTYLPCGLARVQVRKQIEQKHSSILLGSSVSNCCPYALKKSLCMRGFLAAVKDMERGDKQ